MNSTSTRRSTILGFLAVCACALFVHSQAVTTMLSQDDLLVLEQATGIREAPVSLWRLLSGPGLFRGLLAMWGLDASAYHLLVLGLHTLAAGLVYLWIRSRGRGVLAAACLAGMFASTPHFYTLILQATGIGEVLTAVLVLGAFLVVELDKERNASLAVALGLLGALSKEVACLPGLVLFCVGFTQSRTPVARAWYVAGSAALVGFGLWLALSRATLPSLNGEAYVLQWSRGIEGLGWYGRQLWSWSTISPDLRGASSHAAQVVACCAVLGLGVCVLIARAGRLGALAGLLALLPVLPLSHHRFVALGYLPAAFLAVAVADVAGRLESWTTGRSWSHGMSLRRVGNALLACAAVLWVAAAGMRISMWLSATGDSGLPSDPILRRMVVANVARQSFAVSVPEDVETLTVVPGPGRPLVVHADGRMESSGTARGVDLVREVLDEGRALRLGRPSLKYVEWPRDAAVPVGVRDVAMQRGLEFEYMGKGRDACVRIAHEYVRAGDLAGTLRLPLVRDTVGE